MPAPESPYRLTRHVSFCEVEDGVVLLNLRSGAYLGLGQPEFDALRSLVDGWGPRESPGMHPPTATAAAAPDANTLAEELVKRDILTRDFSQGVSATACTITLGQELALGGRLPDEPRITPMHIVRLIRAYLVASLLLRRYSMEQIVFKTQHKLTRQAVRTGAADDDAVRSLVNVFFRLRPVLYRAKDACLFDSLTLVHFLLYYGISPTWVVGVSTRPFEAHSWVQQRDVILNDTLDRAQRFTPILAI